MGKSKPLQLTLSHSARNFSPNVTHQSFFESALHDYHRRNKNHARRHSN